MLVWVKMAPFGLRFGRNGAKWFDQHFYMPPASVLHHILIKIMSENITSVFLTGFSYKIAPICFLDIPYIDLVLVQEEGPITR